MLQGVEGRGEWGLCGRTVGVLLHVPPTLTGVRENRCRGLLTQKRGDRWKMDKDEVVSVLGDGTDPACDAGKEQLFMYTYM